MPDKIDQATASLREFVAKGGAEPIEKAVDALEEFDIWSLPPGQRLAARRRLLLNWSRVLSAIDRIKQPGFDPDANAPPIRPGSTPAADYEKRKAIHREQTLLVELEERAIQAAHRAAKKLYTTSAADRKEMDAAFREGGLSDARKAQVLEGPKPPTPVPPPGDGE